MESKERNKRAVAELQQYIRDEVDWLDGEFWCLLKHNPITERPSKLVASIKKRLVLLDGLVDELFEEYSRIYNIFETEIKRAVHEDVDG